MANIATLRNDLTTSDQQGVLRFYDQLEPAQQDRLAAQLEALDFGQIKQLVQEYVKSKPGLPPLKDIQPVKAFPYQPTPDVAKMYVEARELGNRLLKEGKIGAFLVAGGQGTRLGYEGPKGEYPVTPIRKKPLFEVFAEQLTAHSRDAGRVVPWYIMTSQVNDSPTRAFFKKHNHFGYDPANVFFFQQGMMPAFSMDGQMLLAEKDSLALSPDGHGGSLRALARSGALADMRRRGVTHLSYFQVDNPLVHTIDPLFIGLHAMTESEMSSKVVSKADALEKVGNFVLADGATQVIEYSDLPESLARQTNSDGSLRFNAGSIAIHALSVAFIERLNSGGQLKLPWHRAEKKVPYVDEKGNAIKPEKPNAVKLEQFVFDAIPLARNAMVFETDRAEEFSPVKNAEGTDSPQTCARDQIRRAARWLRAAGVEVTQRPDGEPDATLEISPTYAVSARQLAQRPKPIGKVEPGASIYFGQRGVVKS